MKRYPQDPNNFSLISSLDEFAKSEGLSIHDLAAREGFITLVRNSLETHISHKTRANGLRLQSMFAHMAAALGETIQISEEDSGAFFDKSGKLRRPDFRVICRSKKQMFIEVKNFYQKTSPFQPFKISGNYLSTLKKYAEINDVPLYLAIYWSKWNQWTLLDASRFDESHKNISVSLADAFCSNEMHLLGDWLVSTLPPLSLRIYPNNTEPLIVNDKGEVRFTVAKACICCNGIEVVNEVERRIAWYLMLHGKWNSIRNAADMQHNSLKFVEMQIFPEHSEADEDSHPFKSVGYLSQMITNQLIHSTSKGGIVTRLSPKAQPDCFGVNIPRGYKGDVLKLWLFKIFPKHADRNAIKADWTLEQ